MPRKKPHSPARQSPADQRGVVGLRIIGGDLRGRKLQYSGDLRTRPMKDRVREAIFNLLGTSVEGTLAIDLFAGTGALGLEAISRGADSAIFIERHWPTAKLIEQNAASIGIRDRVKVDFGDAFMWSANFQPPPDARLTVFCSPPFDFYEERREAMLALISRWVELCQSGGQVVVEADERFDFATLPQPDAWDIRSYLPAVVGIFEPTIH
jgi:16S rRNA (guanine966-N2)-methyltransferase